MSRIKIAAAGIVATFGTLLPLIALADGGHEPNDGDPLTTTILVISIASALVAVGILYLLPNNKTSALQFSVAGFGTITMVIHLLLGLGGDLLLLFNALGYALLLVLLLAPIGGTIKRRSMIVAAALFIYTLATFVGYFVTHASGQYSTLGILSKIVELALMFSLGVWIVQTRSAILSTAKV